MSLGSNGMSMNATTGGRSMSMNLGGAATGPSAPTPGPGNPTSPTAGNPSAPSTSVARASTSTAVRDDGEADYRRCLGRAERATGSSRDRMLRRCRGLR